MTDENEKDREREPKTLPHSPSVDPKSGPGRGDRPPIGKGGPSAGSFTDTETTAGNLRRDD